MPLARLTVRSAVRLARSHVVCRTGAAPASVRWRFPDGSPGAPPLYRFADPKAARAKARELRIYVALLALGVESTNAHRAAADAKPGKRDHEVVGAYMEWLALTSPAKSSTTRRRTTR